MEGRCAREALGSCMPKDGRDKDLRRVLYGMMRMRMFVRGEKCREVFGRGDCWSGDVGKQTCCGFGMGQECESDGSQRCHWSI